MKINMQKLLGLLLAAAVTVSTVPTVYSADTVSTTKNSGFSVSTKNLSSTSKSSGSGKLAPLNSEFVDYLNNPSKYQSGKNNAIPSSLDLSYLNYSSVNSSQSLPTKYDLRDYGLISSPRDQGHLGSCWSFASLGSAQSTLVAQFPQIDLSERHLAWFNHMSEKNLSLKKAVIGLDKNSKYADVLNRGGWLTDGETVLASWKGPVSESVLPYTDETIPDSKYEYQSDYHLSDSYYMYGGVQQTNYPDNDTTIKNTKDIILKNGAVTIMTRWSWDCINNSSYAYYFSPSSTAVGGHAITIIGWDDNYSRNNFKDDCQPDHDGAWLVQNSWDSDWGNRGCFWMSYENCTSEIGQVLKMDSANNYKTNYQYDDCGWGCTVSTKGLTTNKSSSNVGYMSNIFTAEDNQQLEAAAFYTTDANTKYEISVYTGTDSANPKSGTLAYSGQSGTEEYAGYHTIPLDKAVHIKKGENFSIVVKLQNPNYSYTIPVEVGFTKYNEINQDLVGHDAGSFYSADGTSWHDISDVCQNSDGYQMQATNVCLKAFANPDTSSTTAMKNVQFSIIEGTVALGSKLTLKGQGDIYYSIDGVTKKYTQPITIDKAETVSAWGEVNGEKGNVTSRTYTKATSMLQDCQISDSNKKQFYDFLDDKTTFNYDMPPFVDKCTLKIICTGTDNITLNGQTIKSNRTQKVTVSVGDTLTLTSSADGKNSTTYTFKFKRTNFKYNYSDETVTYDDTKYTMYDSSNNVIKNGGSISKYIITNKRTDSTVVKGKLVSVTDSSDVIDFDFKKRTDISSNVAIDYSNETTAEALASKIYYSENEDMSNAKTTPDKLNLEAGKVLYFQQFADKSSFKSEIVKVDVPQRPKAPTASTKEIGVNSITFDGSYSIEYYTSNDKDKNYIHSSADNTNTISDLYPNTEYTVKLKTDSTDKAFASETKTVKVKTLDGMICKVYYYIGDTYICCQKVGLKPGKNTVTADKDFMDEYLVSLKDKTKNTLTLNVIGKSGDYHLENEKEIPAFYLVANLDKNTNYNFKVSFWDSDNNQVGKDTNYSFSAEKVAYYYDEIAVAPTGYYVKDICNNTINQRNRDTVAFSLTHTPDSWHILYDELFAKMPNVMYNVRKAAKINVVYKDTSGKVIDNSQQTVYIDEEGTTELTAKVPSNYTLKGETAKTANISSDEYGNLSTKSSTITFVASKNNASSSSSSSSSSSDSSTDSNSNSSNNFDSKPSGSKDNPNTGFKGITAFTLLILAGALCISGSKEKSQK